MKKLFATLFVAIIFSSTAALAASDTPVTDWINNKTSKVTQTEKNANAKIDAAKKQQEAKRAENQAKVDAYKKQQEAKRAENQARVDAYKKQQEAKRAENQAKIDASKQKVETKKQQFKQLLSN